MRPLRLTMVAFGPYAGTEVVDFDALTELGLFVVAGNNGSGKTTIFDALHYALFGTLPGRRSQYIRLKSDHADHKVECSVTLDFAAHGNHWRVERSPKQKRPKRRGTGSTEVDRRATLYRLDPAQAEAPVALANKIGEVDQRCHELVGLSGKQFERVALLPQGEFSRVLRESSTDRRELLRTLFSSEIFDDATALLTEQATEATAADRATLERIDHRQAVLAQELSELIGRPISQSETPANASNAAKTLGDAIVDFRRVEVSALADTVSRLEQQVSEATAAHQVAHDLCVRLQRRVQVEQELAQHQAAHPQHLLDIARLDQGRAAIPVANQAQTVAHQNERVATATAALDNLTEQLHHTLTAAGVPPIDNTDDATLAQATDAAHALGDQLAKRSRATSRLRDIDATTARLQGDLRKRQNELITLAQQLEIAQAQHRQATNEHASLATSADAAASEHELRATQALLEQRLEFDAIETEHQQLVQRAVDTDAAIGELRAELDRARQAQSSHARLQAKADAAFAALEAVTGRAESARSFHDASAQLVQARADYDTARATANSLWDSFIAGTAARVAEALTDDAPCPVCGSPEHPAPARPTPGETAVTQEQVGQARDRADQLQGDLRLVEARIESLRAAHNDIASLSIVELDAETSTAKAMALGAQAAADESHHEAARHETIDAELAQATIGRSALAEKLHQVDQRRNLLRGALGDTALIPLHELRDRLETAIHARAAADELAIRQAELQRAIDQAAQNIESTGLEQLAAESRRSSVADQLAQQQADLATAQGDLAQIDQSLAATYGAVPLGSSYEQRAMAARQAQDLLTQVSTAAALHGQATSAARRAQSMLDDRLRQSPFDTVDQALAAFVDPSIVEQLKAQIASHSATGERLRGQLHELNGLPEAPPDITALAEQVRQVSDRHNEAQHQLIATTTNLDRIESDLAALVAERERCQTGDLATRRLERVAALVKGDNDRNTSLENWVLAAHLRDVVELANIRLARSTHQRFQLCVLDDGENKRGRWGLDLGVEDTVTGTRRPTAGLSGGELFQASLALALGLADAVMNQSAGVRIDALFIDEGFGSLDEASVERAIDLLDELRDRGAMVGVITHVPALLDALPLGVNVVDAANGQGSTIQQRRVAA